MSGMRRPCRGRGVCPCHGLKSEAVRWVSHPPVASPRSLPPCYALVTINLGGFRESLLPPLMGIYDAKVTRCCCPDDRSCARGSPPSLSRLSPWHPPRRNDPA